MAQNGVRTTDLPALTGLDEVIVNHEGTTGLLPRAALVALVNALTGPAFELLYELNADLDWGAGTLATVWGDASAVINGVYQKSGASGEGAWARIGGLPITALTEELLADKADTADLDALEAQVASVAAGLTPVGGWDASSGAFPAGANANEFYVASVAGTVDGQTFAIGDWLIARIDAPSIAVFAGNWTRADYSAVVASVFFDAAFLTVGTAAAADAQLNTLYLATEGHINDGGLDYGLSIAAFEPGIALIDRSALAGQSLINGSGGEITLQHDPVNNDGTIGAAANLTTVQSASFSPAVQRFYVDDVEALRLDATGLQLNGEQVATQDFFDGAFAAALDLALPKHIPTGLGSAVNINGSQLDQIGSLASSVVVPAGTWIASCYPSLRFNAASVSDPGNTGIFTSLSVFPAGTTVDVAGLLLLTDTFWKPEALSPWEYPALLTKFTLGVETTLDFGIRVGTSSAIVSDTFQVGFGPLFLQPVGTL